MKRKTSMFGARALLAALPVSMLAGVYLLSSGAAVTASQDLRATFVELDLNRDGALSVDEFEAIYLQGANVEAAVADGSVPAACAADFAAMSMSSDDVVAMAKAELDEMDTDGDAKVSFAEMLATTQRDRAEEFLEMDVDRDGLLSAVEVSTYFNEQNPPLEIATDMPEGADAEPDPMPLSDACIAALELQWVDDGLAAEEGADAPKDGALDAALVEGVTLWLSEMDMNDDGKVSLGEYIKY